jgi:sodium-dependent dicarboxylate transporter 2/3/5
MIQTSPKTIGFWAGFFLFLFFLFLPATDSLSKEAIYVAAVVVLMATWWATEAIPLPATALLPLALFPLLGIFGDIPSKDAFQLAANPYAHANIFLFLGGFILALAIEKVNLHKRMALKMLLLVGTDSKYLIGGFMLVSGLLSMWIFNTSTTLMLLPIALAVATVVQTTTNQESIIQFNNFQTALLLGIAYAATIGGMATIVGTGPNVLVVGLLLDEGIEVGFLDWMLLATPISFIMLFIGWWLLTNVAFPTNISGTNETKKELQNMYAELGKVSEDERRVFIIFCCTAFAWIFRKLLIMIPGLEGLTDYGIAIIAALALFITPSTKGEGLLEWSATKNLPWGILILFGGGLSIAAQIKATGLGDWIGSVFSVFSDVNPLFLIFIIVTLIVFLTEVTSNQATTATFVPIMFAIALGLGFDKAQLAIPVALAASCAFMLPVATPPNAIVYGSEKFNIADMIKAGFYINIAGIVVVTLFATYALPAIIN